jgi:chromosome segregation ATPase
VYRFSVFEENLKQLDAKRLEVEQLRAQYENRNNIEQELKAKIRELQTKVQLVQDENARLIGGGSERCTLGVRTAVCQFVPRRPRSS